MRRQPAQKIASNFIARGPTPSGPRDARSFEAFDRSGDSHGQVFTRKKVEALDARNQLTQTARYRDAVVADAGYEPQAGDYGTRTTDGHAHATGALSALIRRRKCA